MARFDVHRCRRAGVPYLVDNQADFLHPLADASGHPAGAARQSIPSPIERLHLRVIVGGRDLILATNLMASVRRDQLGDKVHPLANLRSEIVAAVDFLQQGF